MHHKCKLLLVTFGIFLVNCLHSTKINQKIFVDVDSINFVDAQKNGFLLILHETFVKNFLQDILLPTVYVTVQRLSQKNSLNTQEPERTVKILYPESLQVNWFRNQIDFMMFQSNTNSRTEKWSGLMVCHRKAGTRCAWNSRTWTGTMKPRGCRARCFARWINSANRPIHWFPRLRSDRSILIE